MTVYFKDLFDGSDDLSTHTPDVGAAYTYYSGGGSTTDLSYQVLNGTGALCGANASGMWPYPYGTLASSPGALDVWRFTLKLAFSAPTADDVFFLFLLDSTDTRVVGFSINPATPQVHWRTFQSGSQVFDNYPTVTLGATATFEIDVDPGNGTVTLSQDGSVIDTTTYVPDTVPAFFRFYFKGGSDASTTMLVDALAVASTDEVIGEEEVSGDEAAMTHSGDWTLTAQGSPRAVLAHDGAYSLYAYGYSPTARYGLTVSHGGGYSALAKGSARAKVTHSSATISATGVTTILGTLTGKLPAATLAATGIIGIVGTLAKSHRGRYGLSVRASAKLARKRTAPTGAITAIVGSVGSANLQAPRLTLATTTNRPIVGTAYLVMPAARMVSTARLSGSVPRMVLLASANSVITVEYEGYSATLLETETGTQVALTHYTDFPFDRIVRFRDTYYGVAADGIYELGGDTLDGDPIVSVVETAETDFGQPTLKRPRALFLSGRVGADMVVTPVSSEADEADYYYQPVDKTRAGAGRVLFGRGLRYTYVGYRFTNDAGEDFVLDGFTPEVDVQRRTI